MAAPLRLHVDVLAWLYVFWGLFGVLTGLSLLALAVGTEAALSTAAAAPEDGEVAVWMLAICGGILAIGGVAMSLAGRALGRRQPSARPAALALSVANLIFVPFGTALAIYAAWVLLNDEARREFGRSQRHPDAVESMERL